MNRYNRASLLTTVISLAVLGSFALANALKAPEVIPRDKGSITVSDAKGNLRWTADWTMEPSTVNGRTAVRFTERGKGRYSPFNQDVQWTVEAVWTADGSFKPLHFERTFRTLQGAVLETDTKDFDPAKGTVQVVRKRPNSAAETRTVSVPPDTIGVEGIAGVLRSLPFADKHPFPLHLFGNDDRLWDVRFEMRGREMIHTPAGDFDCYKVEMVPHLGMLDVVRKFLPKTHLWFTVAPPHFWVKYEGLENGVGSPSIVMQLNTYEPARQSR